MTSTADTAQHPDVSEISDLTEGLLPPSRAVALRRHIDACEDCGAIHASLEEIRSLLGTVLPLHEHMPQDVADRIDAALVAEAAPVSTPSDATKSVSRETYDSPTEGAIAPRPAGRPRGATGPGRTSRRRRRTVILGTAFGAAAVGMSVFLLQSLQPSQDSGSSMADRGVSSAEKSAADFSEGTLENQVHALLNGGTASEAPGNDPGKPSLDTKSSPGNVSPDAVASPRTPMRAPAVDVPPCVQEGTGRDTPALAVEGGSYQGTAAFLVLLPHATDSRRVQAYVVDAACVNSTPATKGQLLFTHSYARR
ncbi:anti-sigma factor family protein [Streptomyces sp. NPDC057287]|uniref:anti-sigma factor family protein n=1 Tax=Streptomyces sp. NPDC057287 TaxID=3346086 RepID=UPI00364348C4